MMADFFEKSVKLYYKPKIISNWMMGDLQRNLNEKNLEIIDTNITPKLLIEMIKLIEDGTISGKIAKGLLPDIMLTGNSPFKIIKQKNLVKISSSKELQNLIDQVFNENPKCVKDALNDRNAAHFLIGQLMKKTKGQADPELSNRLIYEKLESLKLKEE